MLLDDLVQTSNRVAQTSGRLAKIELLAALLQRAAADEVETAIGFLSGAPRQGRIGVGYASLEAARGGGEAAPQGSLELAEADALPERLTRTTGKGSTLAKEGLPREPVGPGRGAPERRPMSVSTSPAAARWNRAARSSILASRPLVWATRLEV